MILIRQHQGALYFLGREGDESVEYESLREGYPGRDVAVVYRSQGLLIARVGVPVAAPGREAWHPEFAVVELEVPAAERIHPWSR